MKKLLCLLMILFCLTCGAQEKFVYSEVINVDSTSSGIIYNKIKSWCNNYYKSPDDKFQYDDINKKLINGSTSFIMYMNILLIPTPINIYYNMEIQIKDNRFKIQFENFNILSEKESSKYASDGQLNYIYKTLPDDLSTLTSAKLSASKIKSIKKYNEKELIECEHNIKGIINNLKEYLNKSDNNNW